MTVQLHIFAWALAVSMTALAATSVFCAVDALDGMVHRWRDRRAWRAIDLGQPDPEPGSEREANLLLARWAQEGGDDA